MIRLILLSALLFLNSMTLFTPILKDIIQIIDIVFFSLAVMLEIYKKSKTTTEFVPPPIEEDVPIEEPISNPIQPLDSMDKTYENSEFLLNLYSRYFYFKKSIPIIEALTLSTQEFEKETLKKVFNQFELIWNESETLINESEKTMQSIFDSNNSSNLGYILNSSKEINKDFKNFLPELENMNQLAENFVNVSMESFNSISKTTKEIEDLAEQVKVISINVRIEAARVQDSGGFKVLGADITKFADKTSKFAKSTDDKITNTINTIEQLQKELSTKLEDVSLIVTKMYGKINPFEIILETSAKSLKSVIGNLHRVSGELNSNVKTSLGNLQFQDITSQEMNHIIDFLKHVENSVTDTKDIENLLHITDKEELKKDILIQLDKISTTGNEAEIIADFGKKWGIIYKDEHNEDFNSIDDGTYLF